MSRGTREFLASRAQLISDTRLLLSVAGLSRPFSYQLTSDEGLAGRNAIDSPQPHMS